MHDTLWKGRSLHITSCEGNHYRGLFHRNWYSNPHLLNLWFEWNTAKHCRSKPNGILALHPQRRCFPNSRIYRPANYAYNIKLGFKYGLDYNIHFDWLPWLHGIQKNFRSGNGFSLKCKRVHTSIAFGRNHGLNGFNGCIRRIGRFYETRKDISHERKSNIQRCGKLFDIITHKRNNCALYMNEGYKLQTGNQFPHHIRWTYHTSFDTPNL